MQQEKTRRLLKTFLLSATIYLGAQESLSYLIWSSRTSINTCYFANLYFLMPAISLLFVCCTFATLSRYYKPTREHYVLYGIAWGGLFIFQMVPPLIYGLNIIYTTWTFIMATSVAGTIIFQDLALFDHLGTDRDELKFQFDELKFYLDRLTFVWVALGTVTGVAMSILWQGPEHAFDMQYSERVLWAVYMVLSFATVTVIVFLFYVCPIYRKILAIRQAFSHGSPSLAALLTGMNHSRHKEEV